MKRQSLDTGADPARQSKAAPPGRLAFCGVANERGGCTPFTIPFAQKKGQNRITNRTLRIFALSYPCDADKRMRRAKLPVTTSTQGGDLRRCCQIDWS